MDILVVGAGATGGFFGTHLVRAGRSVDFLVRRGRADLLRTRGLRVTGLDGTQDVIQPHLVTADALRRTYDVVLVAVKATGLDRAIEDFAPAIGPGTAIVPFLNGMAHLDELGSRFGAYAVLGGVVRVAASVTPDGGIVQLGPFNTLVVGTQRPGPADRVDRTVSALSGAGFDVEVSPDIVAAMWHKWVFIASAGATNGLARGTVGEIVAVPDGAALPRRILAEAAAVSTAAGYPPPPAEIAYAESLLTQEGSPFTSSMYRDLATGRLTEVEQILGDLTGRARALDVDTPLLDAATLTLRMHNARVAAA